MLALEDLLPLLLILTLRSLVVVSNDIFEFLAQSLQLLDVQEHQDLVDCELLWLNHQVSDVLGAPENRACDRADYEAWPCWTVLLGLLDLLSLCRGDCTKLFQVSQLALFDGLLILSDFGNHFIDILKE